MKIALAQMDSIVGDFSGNYQKILGFLDRSQGADLVVFPECALSGYPAQDLLDYRGFTEECEKFSNLLVSQRPQTSFIFGSIELNRKEGKPLRNVAIFSEGGKLKGVYCKQLLPTYDVFDEDRFFEPGVETGLFEFRGKKLGISICEDVWSEEEKGDLWVRYKKRPLELLESADIFINLSASPFDYEKVSSKREMLKKLVKTYSKPLVYVNSVGANDGLIFDGRSYVWDSEGQLIEQLDKFSEDFRIVDLENLARKTAEPINEISEIYDALVLGIRDYCGKQGFNTAALGLSGGIDSALVACLASDALGADNIHLIMMPSRFTSAASNRDAILVAKALQSPTHILAIEDLYSSSLMTLEKTFEGVPADVTEENIQARIRGLLLMAISNKFGCLVLATGNKSELATGYCTLYGDMCGGLAPISDVYKTQVYELCREANRRSPRIPDSIFSKAPSAELRPNQKDEDSLPAYEVLDRVLKLMIEGAKGPGEIMKEGISPEIVERIQSLHGKSEYKRFQMPLGLKVSKKAFGVGRRIPLVNSYFSKR